MAKRKALGLIDEAVEGVKDLLFMHNTNAKKLARQDAIGGLPNPSIAVTQRDIPFEGFGDISLIGRPERFDPSSRQNPLFSADAYTVRAPSPVRVANKNAYKQFKSDYEAYRGFGSIDDVAYSLGDLESKSRIEPSDFRRVNDFFEYDNAAKLKFAEDNNIPVPRKENGDIDYHALSDVKSQNADKYEQWRQGEISKYFQPEEYFVTNPDYDRYSGRANLQPYTAENVSKWMSKRAGAGQESTMTFGAGNVRASTTERIKSLEQARQMKGQLKPAEDMAEFKQTSDMMLGDLQDALKDYYQYDTNSFSYFDSVGEMIALSEKKGLKRAMEEVGFKDVPKELIQEIEDYKGYLRSAPTEYFESKPQRPVQLSDFGGAIVPENTPKGLIDRLTDAGLRVEKYGDEAERVAARDKFKDLMFVRPEAAITAGLLTAGALSSDRANAGLLSTGTKVARSVADETKRLIDMGYPESVAERIASGELDMSPQARLARAEAFGQDVYHASKQDISEFKAGYNDDQIFTTPNIDFANNWLGKGKYRFRLGTEDEISSLNKAEREFRESFFDYDLLEKIEKEQGRDAWRKAYDEMQENYLANKGLNPDDAYKTIYPLKAKAEKTFDPSKDYEKILPVIEKYYGSLSEEAIDLIKKGHYMPFENAEVTKWLRDNGYDSIKLSENADGRMTTFAVLSPNQLRSVNAAFDPQYTGSNILGSRVIPTVATGLLGASVLGSALAPQKAQAGVWGAPVREMAERVLKGDGLLFHSGTADQAESLAQSIDPQYGNWLQEIAMGSVDDPENFLANIPEASWYADSPSWVKMKVAQKLKKPVGDVTRDDIEKYGQLSIVDPSTTWDEGAEFWRIPEQGTGEGERTIIENLLGEKMPMYQTPLYSYDDFTGQSNYVFGLEPNDIVTTESIEPIASYTGQDLLEFLDQINNNKTSFSQTGASNKNTLSIRPEVSIPVGLLTAGALTSKDVEAGALSAGTKAARSIGDEVKRLIDMGYPESVARRIASGDLVMDYASRMQRAAEQGYDPRTYYHGGAPNLLSIDPTVSSSRKTEGTGTWFSDMPEVANSYLSKDSQLYPVRINTQGMDMIDAEGAGWASLPSKNLMRDGAQKYPYPDDHTLSSDVMANMARKGGRAGLVIDNVVDLGPNGRMPKQINDDWRQWLLDYEQKGGRSVSVQDPNRVRSVNAAFDPEYVGPNMLGNADPRLLAGLAGGSLLGAAVIPKDAEASVSGAVKQALDINYPRQVTVGEAKTPEANYNLLDAAVPAAIAYDYGNGANFPVRPAQPAPEPKPQKSDITPTPSVVPMGTPINPYTFLMSTGADQGEAARYVTDAYTNIARGTGNAIAGFGGEMETLGKGLMYALTGQGLGGSPWSRFMHVLNKYDPQLPNTQDVGRVPALLPNVSPMTEEERRMYQLAGEFLSPL